MFLSRTKSCRGDGHAYRHVLYKNCQPVHGTLQMVHDWSYMSKVDPTICSAAFLLMCISTGHRATGTIVEKSDPANNYCDEGLGDIGGLLVLRAETPHIFPYKECVACCDNLGIVQHAEKPHEPLPEKSKPRGRNQSNQTAYCRETI